MKLNELPPLFRRRRFLADMMTTPNPKRAGSETGAPFRRRLLALLLLAATALRSFAAADTSFFYNGELEDGGTPASGEYNFIFTLFEHPTGGSPVGTPNITNGLPVNGGQFTARLDFGKEVFDGSPRWLRLEVKTNLPAASHTTLSPRQALGNVPYAVFAASAGSVANESVTASSIAPAAVTTPTLADGAVTGGKIAEGNVVRSVNGLTDALTLAAGPNITLGTVGNTMTIAGIGGLPGWSLAGNSGLNPSLNFLGTTDNQPLQFKVNNAVGLRLEYGFSSGPTDAPSIIGGSAANSAINASDGSIPGMTIAGGGVAGSPNTIELSAFGTIGGGSANLLANAAGWSVISGGQANKIREASGYSVIGGGLENEIKRDAGHASGLANTISGGYQNYIETYTGAFIGGGSVNHAQADHAVIAGGTGNLNLNQVSFLGGGSANHIGLGYASVLGGGQQNSVAGDWSFTGGGIWNTNAASNSTIGGGRGNVIEQTGHYSAISGGHLNRAAREAATVSGGQQNHALAPHTTVGGGRLNSALAEVSTVSGGVQNTNNGVAATISGGALNAIEINAQGASVGGGENNKIKAGAAHSTVSGGNLNEIHAGTTRATVGGGNENIIQTGASGATIAGGSHNRIETDAFAAAVGGGTLNIIQSSSVSSTIGGGELNLIQAATIGATIGAGKQNRIETGAHYASISGGRTNVVGPNALNATIGGGIGNGIGDGASYASVPGGKDALAINYGQMAYASGSFAAAGDAQTCTYLFRGVTSDETFNELYLDGISKRLRFAPGTAGIYEVLIVGTTSLASAPTFSRDLIAYKLRGGFDQRTANSIRHIRRSAELIGDGFIGYPDPEVNQVTEVNGERTLGISVRGFSSPMRWVASMRTVEVVFP